jgi:hypothetical protein
MMSECGPDCLELQAANRIEDLETIIVRARQAFRKGEDPVDCRSWLFRVEIDEALYPEIDLTNYEEW